MKLTEQENQFIELFSVVLLILIGPFFIYAYFFPRSEPSLSAPSDRLAEFPMPAATTEEKFELLPRDPEPPSKSYVYVNTRTKEWFRPKFTALSGDRPSPSAVFGYQYIVAESQRGRVVNLKRIDENSAVELSSSGRVMEPNPDADIYSRVRIDVDP